MARKIKTSRATGFNKKGTPMKTRIDKFLLLSIIAVLVYTISGCKPVSKAEANTIIPDYGSGGGGSKDTSTDAPESSKPAVKMALLTSDNGLFFDSGTLDQQSNIDPEKCGDACYTDANTIVKYTESGQIATTTNNITDPDLIVTMNDGTIYQATIITPAEAFDAGMLPRYHTQLWKNSIELGGWTTNEYEAKKLIKTSSEHAFAINQHGSFENIDHIKTDVSFAGQDNLMIYQMDSDAKTARIADATHDVAVSWFWNFFLNAKHWLYSPHTYTWYSANGYNWNWLGVTEHDGERASLSSRWVWNLPITTDYPVYMPWAERPQFLNAGTRVENSETVLYWIECSTGWVIKYIPSTDAISSPWRLYEGDGYKDSGQAKQKELKPALNGDSLYFTNDGSVWELNLDTDVVEIYYGGEGQVVSF